MREFYTIPDGTVDAMLANADAYAAQHKNSYYEILDCYNQVKQKGDGTPRQAEVDDKISKTKAALQKAVADTISQYEKQMRAKMDAKDAQGAYEVWKTFPPSLRNRQVDDQIMTLLRQTLPPDFSPRGISR